MKNNKAKIFASAKNKIADINSIPLSDVMKKQISATLLRKDVKIVAEQHVSDTSDEGHYKLVDMKGNVLFEIMINPYTIRVLQQDKVIARCNITPIRGETYDDVEITDKNMEDIVYTIISRYNSYQNNLGAVALMKGKEK